MKPFLLLAALALSPALGACALADPAPAKTVTSAKPNIILFLVDDMGWQDTSVPFWTEATPLNKKYHTPNMEKLAAQGMKFTQAYATPVCSPSRVSLMTGMNAARHRVTHWTRNKGQATDKDNPRLTLPAWNVNGLSPDPATPRAVHAPFLPALLHDAGYRTLHVGKAHFGAIGTPGENPRAIGFDVNIAGHALGGPGSYLGKQNYSAAWRGGGHVWDVPGLEKYHGTQTFLTEALTLDAIKELEKAQDARQPFFLYMAHYAVHVPFAADPRFIAKHEAAGLDKTEAMYAALVEGMDKSLGDLMTHLEKRGIADNTVILFMSDNGGLSIAGRGGRPDTHNQPLACGKGSLREGGIREPMIVKWPGHVKAASTCDTPVIIEDFFPTLLGLSGTKEAQSDGVSFLPLLAGASGDPGRALVWHFPNVWGEGGNGPGYGPASAIRQGDWKYVFWHDPAKNPREELFNLKDDIGETVNLAGKNPAKTRELATLLRQRLRAMEAQMPVDKATGKAVEIP